jgi:hypothetical protein
MNNAMKGRPFVLPTVPPGCIEVFLKLIAATASISEISPLCMASTFWSGFKAGDDQPITTLRSLAIGGYL